MDQNQHRSLGSLRPMVDDDLERVLAWRNHPDVRHNMYSQQVISLESHQSWWAGTKALPSSQYLIFEVDSQPLAAVNFTEISPTDGTAFWGFYTGPEAPKGTGTKLGFAALDYGFSDLGLHKLCAEVLAYNAASLGFHRMLGFSEEGLFKAQKKVNGIYEDVHRLAIFTQDWAKARPKLHAKILGRL
jgi:UDP-4-amino-4,6-dideoxy-N-acetyl-beta-L-altrosamine N-acetyltransferase